jgi:hypothetical protein
MSEASSVEEILGKAKEEEGRYEWLKAADCYQKALTTVAETDFLGKGQILEDLAYVVYKAAFQAEGSIEFKAGVAKALVHYEEARGIYQGSFDVRKMPRICRCNAMIAFAGYWLATTAAERRRSIEECWALTKQALESFTPGEKWEFGKTFTQLSLSNYLLSFFLDADGYDSCRNAINEGIRYGEQAIAFLSQLGDQFHLAKAYAQTAIYKEIFGMNSPPPADRERLEQEALSYGSKAKQLSEEAALLECYYLLGIDLDSDRITADAAKSLDYARKAKDKFAIGGAFTSLSMNALYKSTTVQDSDKRAELLTNALDYATNARNEFAKLAWISIVYVSDFWVDALYIRYFLLLASDETDLPKRRDLLQKAADSAPEAFKLAEESGTLMASMYVHTQLSRVYFSLANTQTDSEQKKKMLEQALQHLSESTRMLERCGPFLDFTMGVRHSLLADIKWQIANLTADLEDRKNLLREAIRLKQDALNLMSKDLSGIYSESKLYYPSYGSHQFEYAEMLNSFFKLTGEKDLSEKAVEAYGQAAETFRGLAFVSRSAECWWRIAQAYDVQGEFSKAAESFAAASEEFKEAATSIPKLKDLYGELSVYMEAWKEIEQGKHGHKRQEYCLAQNHFEKAADLHKSSKHWCYLTQNYAAWARMENAEEQSRKGLEEEAHEGFQLSSDLFGEANREIRAHLGKIEDADERQLATSMLKATESRRLYCKARIAIEEAKVLDKTGEHDLSARQYGLAAKMFSKLTEELESETDKGECQFTACLSMAWQKMAEAEAEESPQHYEEASRLFEKAKDFGQSEKTRALVLGHSHFCKALEAGRRFVDTRDMAEYAKAVQQLESATSYYLKAGLQSASEYTKATRLVFDAFVHMGNAALEVDPEKRTRLYMVSEKALEASADSYMKAGDHSRREQALKLLEKAREQRELAISLAEVLRAPIVASTTSFPAPTPTSEKAVGLERFEHAEVNANLILSRRELRIGESVDLEIELANPGKGQALLTQIEEAFPESFDLTTKLESYRVEGHNINMKGRRLDPLKTEEVKFSVKPKHKGSFTVRPRILYLDENGKAKSHQPEPLTITVKELGIKGWITGEA